jgi:L-rhamnose mutarotase
MLIQKKTKVARLGIQIRKLNFLKESQHVKNKSIYVGVARKKLFHLVAQGDGNHNWQKIVQFTCVMHLLKKG